MADPKDMENPAFPLGANPLNSPALMVLASTAEATREVQIQGTHPAYMCRPSMGEKEGRTATTVPFTSTNFELYRQGGSFPPPLYAPHMPPHYVRANLDRGVGLINPGGGGAFRPVTTTTEDPYSLYSKRQKFEGPSSAAKFYNGHEGQHLSQDSIEKQSPAVKEEQTSAPASPNLISDSRSEGGESIDRSTPDEGRNLRRQRKRCSLDGCCPVCGVTIRAGELETHLNLELDKLAKISKSVRKYSGRDSLAQNRKGLSSPSGGHCSLDSPPVDLNGQSRYETYMRIKISRQNRLATKNRGKKLKKLQEETVCPVCSDRVLGSPEELNLHVENCLKKQRGSNEDCTVDVEGDGEQYEEYEWAGQTRIRATTLLQGGFAASGFQTSKKHESDEDADLNVDGDESEQYGKSQYTEADIIPCSADEPGDEKARQALRGAVLRGENTEERPLPLDRTRWTSSSDVREPSVSVIDNQNLRTGPQDLSTNITAEFSGKDQTTTKENGHKQKCLICMEGYTKPLASIQCWHVHCEECWLRTLGAKKLCPQCNMITSPSDLRRIYL